MQEGRRWREGEEEHEARYLGDAEDMLGAVKTNAVPTVLSLLCYTKFYVCLVWFGGTLGDSHD